MGGYERQSAPWSLDAHLVDRIPENFNGQLLEEDWERFGEIADNSKLRVPVMDQVTITKLINGPEAFTPDNEFCLGETPVAGFFVAAGFCAHGLAGAGGIGKVIAEWIVAGEPTEDLWEMDIRRFGPQYASPGYTLKRAKEVYETYYDIRYPGHERSPAGRCASPAPTAGTASTRPTSARSPAGSASTGTRATRRRATSRCDRAAGPGCTGRRRSAPSTARRASAPACSTSPRSPSSRSPARAPRRSSNGSATTASRAMWARSPTRRCSIRAAGSNATSRSRGSRRTFLDRHRHGVRKPRHGLDPPHMPDDGSVRVADVTARLACFALWGPRAREILAPLTPDDVSDEIPVSDGSARSQSATCRSGRCGSRSSASSAGSSTARPSTARPLADTLGGRPDHGLVACGYSAIDTMRLEKGYRVWAADITPDENPYEAGLGFCVKLDKEGGFIGSDGSPSSEQGAPSGGCAAWCSRIPVGRARQRAGADRRRGRRPRHQRRLRLQRRALDRLRLPAPGRPVGAGVEVDIFGRWVAGEVARAAV